MVIEIIGFLLGLLYLWWEYHADRRMWIVGLVMPCISMWVYYTKGLYADFAMNIYYLVMALYGFTAWSRHLKKDKPELPIRHMSGRVILGTLGAFIPVYALIAAWLVFLTDSNVPYADAFTTAMSIVATWALARKYIEQWIMWVLVDAVCTGLYIYKGIYFYSALYAIYTVVAILGYRKWLKLMTAGQ
ncbi:MAG: nicotinamide riboside transporter PnuC [Muribaculaceae bacterium]|nr:nicotinamide riboside transporter PnuC [Muribaculaceae bacterium]